VKVYQTNENERLKSFWPSISRQALVLSATENTILLQPRNTAFMKKGLLNAKSNGKGSNTSVDAIQLDSCSLTFIDLCLIFL